MASPHHSANPYHLPPSNTRAMHNNLYALDTFSQAGGGSGWSPQTHASGASTPSTAGGWGAASGSGTRASNKVAKLEFDDELEDDSDTGTAGGAGGSGGAPEVKKKSTRGSRACTVCRKLKMRCVGAEEGPPCKRCKTSGQECIFEESQRGRRSNRKTDQMAKSLKKMEATLNHVLESIGNPSTGIVATGAGMLIDPSARQQTAFPHLPALSPTGDLSESPQGTEADRKVGRIAPDVGVRFDSHVAGNSAMEWSAVRGPRGDNGEREDGPRLHSLPDNSLNPLGLLAEASLQNTRKRAPTLLEGLEASNGDVDLDERHRKRNKLGVANTGYFQPGPMNILPLRRIVIEQRMPPTLLVEKIVSIEEVVELFAIYFEHCHKMCPFLDPLVHTPSATGSRSPFLFTCICAVASRYYTKRTDDLYRKCLNVSKKIAFDCLTKGFKSTEICQGFLLLCQWNQPAERYEEERTYQFSGIAIRMATDLNLHRKTLAILPDEVSEETKTVYEREIMNRERTWLYCFICDRSISTQMGKPISIAKEDYIIRNSKDWFRSNSAQKSDIGLSAMVEAHRIVGRIIDTLYSDTRSVSGLNVHLDYPVLMRSFLGQLDQWRADWASIFPDSGDLADGVRQNLRDFYHSYYRLFLSSFAVQHALDNAASTIDLPTYCILCFDSASTIITIARDFLGPQGILRYAMDSTFVYLSYAATFLLKLVSPTFSRFVDEHVALSLVEDVITTFERCAVDDTHTPALYASFLRALMDNKRSGNRTAQASRAGTRQNSPTLAQGSSGVLGMEAFLKSRANSLGPDGEEEASMAFPMEDFWNNMLMPGFGPVSGLSGGSGMRNDDPWSITPIGSRAASPNHHYSAAFDFTASNGV